MSDSSTTTSTRSGGDGGARDATHHGASPIDADGAGASPALRASPALPVGQWLTEATGHRWWFDSGTIALDFAYTGPMATTGGPTDAEAEMFHAPDDLTAWLNERFDGVVTPADDRELRDALGLRRAIAGLADAAAHEHPLSAADVDVVNLFAATPDVPPVLPGGSRQAGRSRVRPTQALSTIARETARVLTGETTGRFRECGADDCSIVYFDTSRSGTRRWCSMQRCGNRAKVRAHRARRSGRNTTTA